MNPILAALGVESEAEALQAIGRFTNVMTEIKAATGADSFEAAVSSVKGDAKFRASVEAATGKPASEALGVIDAWKQGAESASALKTELDSMKASQEQAEVKASLDDLVESGRLEPAKRESAEALYKNHGIAAFRAYTEALPAASPSAPSGSTPAQPDPADAVAVTADDLYVAKLFGKTAEEMKAANEHLRAHSVNNYVAVLKEPAPKPATA